MTDPKLWLALCAALHGAGCRIDRSGLGGTGGDPDATVRDAGFDGGRDAGRDASGGDAGVVGPDGGRDAGEPPVDFRDLEWERPSGVDLGRESECDKVFDPIVTHDMRWLLVSYFENDSPPCGARRFHTFQWNDGAPEYREMLGPVHPGSSENNGHLLSGAAAGRPGDHLLVYCRGSDGFGNRDLLNIFLEGDPPSITGSPSSLAALNSPADDNGPTLTATGGTIVFDRGGDLHVAKAETPLEFGAPSVLDISTADDELDAALSPDGRVIVFSRHVGGWDLWVARRDDPEGTFGTPERLPSGAGQINTGDSEWDASIAPNGDLLFTRRDGDGVQRMYHSRAILP